ncbi:Activating molecule in BECN1-regulated autophagy protein 1 [Seminavis robusta]|uniref:Activating molecule in BECN1-regulated autophagy protein 1 n=1 Tax=Seminavis robusta TaxID=568900 RepID=A0A9N8EB13_9STRA|nr:Activating molecule in BECN1-regulated autophagy protein 1 [Seminavis robusta]|eukprot:Sro750_g196980.1 Activating molecule in BECN1-regulated autophagy protein 1 (817) ;mRNA; f:27806-30352
MDGTDTGTSMQSRPSLDWRNHDFFEQARRIDYGAEEDEAWPIPSRESMQEKFAFRQGIREETLQHRRIHKHGGMGQTGRNISLVLRDRELKGASGVALRRRPSDNPKNVKQVQGGNTSSTNNNKHARENGVIAANNVSKGKTTNTNISGSNHLQKPKLSNNRVCYPTKISHEVQLFAEYYSVVRYHSAFFRHLGGDDEQGESGERPSSSKAVSTISIAFSPDSQTMASTHGDHTVKITCCSSGSLLQTLEGHPRTPWTVKYHPIDSAVLASGCLGHQVRLWHWPDKVCLQMIRLEFAIISLSFHPTGNLLAVANGTRLHFWGYNQKTNSSSDTAAQNERAGSSARNSRGILTEVDQRHMLRCVHFPPEGNSIIIGGVNPTTDDPRRRRGGIGGNGMSFYLRLWDFDIGAALQTFDDSASSGRRRAISNPRTFVPRALLYNDGGFDVSPDGKELCACAEYWLPEGVNSAMELVQRDDEEDYSDDEVEADGGQEHSVDGSNNRQSEREGASTPTQTDVPEGDRAVLSTPPPSGTSGDGPRTPVRYSTPVPPPADTHRGNAAASNSQEIAPQTPPRSNRPRLALSPPSPPGRRFSGGVNRGGANAGPAGNSSTSHRIQPLLSTPTQNQQSGPGPIPPPPPPPPPPPGIASRPPHPLSIISGGANYEDVLNKKGRYVPHVVTVSLDTTPMADAAEAQRGIMKLTPVARGYRPRLGQLLEASPLDGAKASAVTCVKFSPSTDFCLIGYGVREPVVEGGGHYHPVTALYRVRGGMTHVSTMLSGDDDVNIARFHPDSGYGFVYGTKQGRVRVLSPRPWNFYH